MPRPATKMEYDRVFRWLAKVIPDGLTCPACKRPILRSDGGVLMEADGHTVLNVMVVCGSCRYGLIFFPPGRSVVADL